MRYEQLNGWGPKGCFTSKKFLVLVSTLSPQHQRAKRVSPFTGLDYWTEFFHFYALLLDDYFVDASHGYATIIAIIERTYVRLYIQEIRNWLPIEENYYRLSLAFPIPN